MQADTPSTSLEYIVVKWVRRLPHNEARGYFWLPTTQLSGEDWLALDSLHIEETLFNRIIANLTDLRRSDPRDPLRQQIWPGASYEQTFHARGRTIRDIFCHVERWTDRLDERRSWC